MIKHCFMLIIISLFLKTECFYEGHEHNEGESWPSLSNPCETCECRSSMTVCQPQRSCDVSCSHGVIPLGGCCSACTGEVHFVIL